MLLGSYTHDEFMDVACQFHGYPAPGIIIGAYMTMLAKERVQPFLSEAGLFNAICETTQCLPDAIQLLTPCTVGNGWMKICDNGRYAMCLYDKYNGKGVRVYLDVDRMEKYPAIKEWFMKTRPKREQDSELLQAEMKEAQTDILSIQEVEALPSLYEHHNKGAIHRCAYCQEPIPVREGLLCKACRSDSPYIVVEESVPVLRAIPVEDAVGQAVLHDMTRITLNEFKGVQVKAGQVLSVSDMCDLQRIGKNNVYILDEADESVNVHLGQSMPVSSNIPKYLHENECARRLATLLSGEHVEALEEVREGKVSFIAKTDGLLWINEQKLFDFHMLGNIAVVTRKQATRVKKGEIIASARAIPLYLTKQEWLRAEHVIHTSSLFSVLPVIPAKVGILITGSEIFDGIIEDKFEPIIKTKVESYFCEVVGVEKAPDDREKISEGVKKLRESGANLIITTAGLSVDPDDVTRKGLEDAGMQNSLYGVPILPGSMSLVGDCAKDGPLETCHVIGVPACALFHKITAFDVILPLVLANAPIDREFFAQRAGGGLCENCTDCTYPKCRFAV